MRLSSEEKDLGVFIYKVWFTRSEIDEIEEKAFSYWRKEADIPGYRKGTAPKELVYQRYSKNIRDTFREMLLKKIEQEISKKHRFAIDSIVLVGRRVVQSKRVIEIPGTEDEEIEFTIKVSTATSIIVEDEEGLKNSLRGIKLTVYSLKGETVDEKEVKRFFFANKKLSESVTSENKNCVVRIFFNVSNKIPPIDLYLYLGDLPKLWEKLKGKRAFETFELALDETTKRILGNYIEDRGIKRNVLGDKVDATLTKIIVLEDMDKSVEEEYSLEKGARFSPVSFLNEEIKVYNIFRVLDSAVVELLSRSKIYLGEAEYIRTLMEVIETILKEYSHKVGHISSFSFNFGYLPRFVFNRIVEGKSIEVLYDIFVGNTSSYDYESDGNIEKLYEKLKEFCSLEVKEITYKDLRNEFPYLLFSSIFERLS
ncbi:MAG: trigger factor [Brevinematia bacterium]